MWGQCDLFWGSPKAGGHCSPKHELGAPEAPLQGTGGEISDGFSPGGIKAGVCTPTPLGHWGARSAGVGQEGLTPCSHAATIPGGSQGSNPSPSKAPMGQERLGGPSVTPSWFVTGRGGWATYASSPMRVTLAERKVCRTKTMGLGQECRSSA